jgi:hypothetical protein
MHYWRKDYFETLRTAAADASRESADWGDYATFCLEYEKGLRQDAFGSLERFIAHIEREPFAERRHFVGWLMKMAHGRLGNHMLVPYPIKGRVVEPTLLEWAEVEPLSSEPLRWIGGVENLERAVALDPADQIAIKELIIVLLSQLDYSTHELPYGYLGLIPEDLSKLDRIEALLPRLANKDDRAALAAGTADERYAIQDYLKRRAQPS